MPWENKEPENKNLEELRNLFSIENIMDFEVTSDPITLDNIEEKKLRFSNATGALRLYTRINDTLYYTQFV